MLRRYEVRIEWCLYWYRKSLLESAGKCYLQRRRKFKRLPVDVCSSKIETLLSWGFWVTGGNRKWRASSTCLITNTFVFHETVQLTILAKNGPQPYLPPQLKQPWKRFSSNISDGCLLSFGHPPSPCQFSNVNVQRASDLLSPPIVWPAQ